MAAVAYAAAAIRHAGQRRIVGIAFNIETYRRTAAPVSYEDLDYGAYADRPLSAGALRCLRYMCDIESHTVCYLRDLLVTPSHADPVITTFLTMWAYEEYRLSPIKQALFANPGR